jgi:hypothetical protein
VARHDDSLKEVSNVTSNDVTVLALIPFEPASKAAPQEKLGHSVTISTTFMGFSMG